jgi:hypothetical protein
MQIHIPNRKIQQHVLPLAGALLPIVATSPDCMGRDAAPEVAANATVVNISVSSIVRNRFILVLLSIVGFCQSPAILR